MKKDPRKNIDSVEDRLAVYALMVKNYIGAVFQNYVPSNKLEGFQRRVSTNKNLILNQQTMSDKEKERLHQEAKYTLLKIHDIREEEALGSN